VVFYHIGGSFAFAIPAIATAILAKGYLAVDLFFVLSGFVMWLTYGEALRRPNRDATRTFLWHRFARIYPLYAANLIVMVLLFLPLLWHGQLDPAAFPLRELPLHVVMAQNWGFTPTNSWNQPAWSISTEFAAYLALPLIAPLLWKLPRSTGFALLATLGLAMALRTGFAAQGHTGLIENVGSLGLMRCGCGFLAGAIACQCWLASPTRSAWAYAALGGIVAALWAFGRIAEPLATIPLFASLVVILAATSAQRYNLFSSRLAVWLGELSYATYLSHCLLWIVFRLAVTDADGRITVPQAALFAALLLVISWLQYRHIERPARDSLRRFAFTRNKAPQGVGSHPGLG
jgi:peptidoglycan/LPS O-acetylase OafA/YrhL